MIVSEAKEQARRWVAEKGRKPPGFQGAYFTGSVTWLPEDAELPATSNVDLHVVLDTSTPREKLGKFLYHSVLLEVPYTTFEQLGSAEEILANHHRAGPFRAPNISSDPSGRLTALQAAVSSEYAKRECVLGRCKHARNHVLRYADYMDQSPPFHDAVTIWRSERES